jgi:hypothetical protein
VYVDIYNNYMGGSFPYSKNALAIWSQRKEKARVPQVPCCQKF